MTIASAALLLFLVMDPLGNIPLFLMTLKNVSPEKYKKVIIRELLIALGVLVFFLFLGQYVLDLLRISEPALTTAGGVILLLIALRMIFPTNERSLREEIDEEPFIVPLAIPYVAGPSALATVMLLISRDPHRWLDWLAALLLAWVVSGVILYFSSGMRYRLGEKGLKAIERLMGMILITVAVEMLMTGVKQYLTK